MAQLARTTGWTMNEVRAHSLGDISAYLKAIEQEQRAARMRASGKAARGR